MGLIALMDKFQRRKVSLEHIFHDKVRNIRNQHAPFCGVSGTNPDGDGVCHCRNGMSKPIAESGGGVV